MEKFISILILFYILPSCQTQQNYILEETLAEDFWAQKWDADKNMNKEIWFQVYSSNLKYGRCDSLIQLKNPLRDNINASYDLQSCSLNMTVYMREFIDIETNNIIIYQATKFDNTETWNQFNLDDNPSIVYTDKTKKVIPVSSTLLGNQGNGMYYYSLLIDLTDVCKELLQRNEYQLYFTLQDKCPVSSTACENEVNFFGSRQTDPTVQTKMRWVFSALKKFCGNGIIEWPEQCDDANNSNNKGCNSTCQIEDGYTCNGQPSICQKCGNGIIEGVETCDDGNIQNSDGCSSICQIENGWWCSGSPSVCQKNGNGNNNDNGNNNNNGNNNGKNSGTILRFQPFCNYFLVILLILLFNII